jgi:ABC-type molybdate transport system substrate-binding protein
MRNDPIFKFVAVIVVAGVLIALLAPGQSSTSPATATVAAAATVAQPAHVTDGAQ